MTGVSARILRPDELPARDRGAGARTVPLVTSARGATSFLNGVTSFEPGAAIAHHVHNVAESVVVLQGAAVVDIDGTRTPLRAFDTTFVPAGIPHHFENASAGEPMTIFWTYAGIEATRTLVASGERGRIEAEQPDGAEPVDIVRESARITVKPGRENAFEDAVAAAATLFQRAHGARTFVLERSHEHPLSYRLTVGWESVDDHLSGFRGSPDFARWRALIGDSIEGLPEVEHFEHVLTAF
ncbi:cupin domain-containing protein [Actinophytocola oryzae]|uniref:Quercetin dioxygenase-like cupin family protein n=1 Tax=Actinophytocola oryzae TaxID=502181 RepID=A0A4R7VKG3_9PSEU|nr:cupin domain-containing protein [Actinophytocola oryzae]TDV49976.1 quercetin dioxygenase-like cupin family protein [Actinophytocola oryzae]